VAGVCEEAVVGHWLLAFGFLCFSCIHSLSISSKQQLAIGLCVSAEVIDLNAKENSRRKANSELGHPKMGGLFYAR
jgi:hypothetical protein